MAIINPKTLPPPLKKGDEVITVAASSVITNEKALLKGINLLETWGLICRPQNLVKRSWGYLAGNDEIRRFELYPQKPTPLIVFARGGWGAARLLEHPQQWKTGWLLGFSDVTSILLSRLAAGFDGGVHGPLLTSLSQEPDWSRERLKRLLFGFSVPDLHGEIWVKGKAKGPLVVANLSVASHLLGSRHIPDLNGAILVLEDVGEEPYRIDRMLTHWRLAGHLKKLSGLAFGSFNNCQNSETDQEKNYFTVEDVLKERSRDLGIPVIGGLPIGHLHGNAALPMGRIALLDGNKGKLTLLSEA